MFHMCQFLQQHYFVINLNLDVICVNQSCILIAQIKIKYGEHPRIRPWVIMNLQPEVFILDTCIIRCIRTQADLQIIGPCVRVFTAFHVACSPIDYINIVLGVRQRMYSKDLRTH